ncbi:MAG: MFS transporter, partial [Deinococcota bacterium]
MKTFYIILLGQLVSVIGSGMTRFGLSVWVFSETGSATAFTTLIFFAVIPLAVGALFAGPLVDRLNRRLVMITGNITAGLSTLAVVLLFYNGVLAPWHLYITLSINGLANAFIIPALEASIPMLVPKEKLERASGLTQIIAALDTIVSPTLAGVLVTNVGLGVVFITDVVTFSLGVLSLLFVVIPQPRDDVSAELSFIGQLRFGARYLLERPAFMILIGFLSVFMFFQGIAYALSGPLVLSFADADGLGIAYAGFGVGALVGGVLLGVWGGPSRRMDGIIGGVAVAGVG